MHAARSLIPLGAALLSLLILVAPVRAATQPVNAAENTWFTFTATAQGNYPGGNLLFTVFAVDSAVNPTENESIDSMTVTAPWGNASASNLPVVLTPQESTFVPIQMQIPSSFGQHTFIAQFLAHAMTWNGTGWTPFTESGNATVDVLAFPSQGSQATVSTTTLALVAGVPVAIALILLGLLIRTRNALYRGVRERRKKLQKLQKDDVRDRQKSV